jgi:NADPH2:quinone reductase
VPAIRKAEGRTCRRHVSRHSAIPSALTEIDRPAPGPGQVLLRIAACGLNFADLLMMKGTYQDTPEPPFTLGMEVAGVVEAHGDGVDAPAIGSPGRGLRGVGRVWRSTACSTRRAACRSPTPCPSQEAAGFLIAYGTSHLALTRRARLQPGERLLVLGAAAASA